MTDDIKNKALLPSGFSDLLPPEAQQEADAITSMMRVFQSYGYNRVKPPMVEFEESLLTGPGAGSAKDTFRLMDPESRRMLGVRSDITAQIARIATTRLQKEPRPLRLTYANDVLRTQSAQQRIARQFTQVGCELVGASNGQSDIEICVVALSALKALGIENITLDLNIPRLINLLFVQYNVDEPTQDDAKKAIADRDIDYFETLDHALAPVLQTLLSHGGAPQKALECVDQLELSSDAKTQIDQLACVYEGIRKALSELGYNDIDITIDMLENTGLEYHNGVSFGFFTQQARAPLGRGGRYNIAFDKTTQSATGFTFYMDILRTALAKAQKKDIVFVGKDENWASIQKLREEGWIIRRATGQDDTADGCTHEFKDGQIIQRS